MTRASRDLAPVRTGSLAWFLALALVWGCLAIVETASPLTAAGAAPQAPLRAGAARIDVTPLEPLALAGYENPENRISEGVHDRLYARAFAFASGNKRVVLVSVDVGAMTLGAYFRRPILDRYELQPDELLLCEIHTHSGPQVSLGPYPHPNNATYTQLLRERLVTVVGRALADLAPARLAIGRGTSSVGASRRKPVDGRIEMAAYPDGPADHEVLVLELARPGGKPFAALFNYSCHSRSLRSPNRLVSGDVIGIAEQFLEENRPGSIVGSFPGASADIDPVTLAAPGPAAPPVPVRLGRQLGNDVLSTLKQGRPLGTPATIRTAAHRVMLLAKAAGAAPRPIEVVAVTIGNTAFVGIDCEASAELGLALKATSPFKDTFVFTVCNGWAGYLPVAHQYPEGGYEVAHTSFAPGAAEQLVKEAVATLAALK